LSNATGCSPARARIAHVEIRISAHNSDLAGLNITLPPCVAGEQCQAEELEISGQQRLSFLEEIYKERLSCCSTNRQLFYVTRCSPPFD
jgi:hypothetical protein